MTLLFLVYTDTSRINHEIIQKGTEIPSLVASCPTGAIRPIPKTKVAVRNEKCMYCGNCHHVTRMQILDAENDGIAILVGVRSPMLALYQAFHA